DYDTLSPPRWVGGENYRLLFTQDPLFWRSLGNTFYMVLFGLPLSMGVSLALAFLLNQKLRGIAFYRTVFYLPSITPVVATPILLFNLIMGLIGTFQYFTQVYVMTNGTGGPEDATLFYALRLFQSGFIDFKMGYASAMAWVLFGITLACALLVFHTSARWVYY